jgi:hypothetical protein
MKIRLNCNLIKGHIDTLDQANKYLDWAFSNCISEVRFAELKNENNNFVSLTSIFGNQYGLNEDPYILGCSQDTVINGINVNFRQMCSFQCSLRPKPNDPEQTTGQVLYYDNQFYKGWQKMAKTTQEQRLQQILQKVISGELTQLEAQKLIEELYGNIKIVKEIEVPVNNGRGCH